MKCWNKTNIEAFKSAMNRPCNAHKKEAMMITLLKMQLMNSKN